MSWPYREVSVLSDREKGQVSHEQLEGLGISNKAIQHSLDVGRITETFARVYAVGDRALPPLPRDVTELDGVPICTPAFALLELAPELSMDGLERAFDDGLTSGVMSLAAAQDTLARHRVSRGASRFALLAHPEHELQITRSQAEQLMRRLVQKSGLMPRRFNWRHGQIFPA